MSRNIVITVALVVAALLLAVVLFVAGAMWRGRITSGTLFDISCAGVRDVLAVWRN